MSLIFYYYQRPTSVEGYTGDVSSEDALDLLPSMGSQPMFSQPSVQESIGMVGLWIYFFKSRIYI